MIRDVETRLRKLEAKISAPALATFHRVIGHSSEECQEKRRGLIEGGQAGETDNFIFRVIVTPREGRD